MTSGTSRTLAHHGKVSSSRTAAISAHPKRLPRAQTLGRKEHRDRAIEERLVLGIGGGAGGMSPDGVNWRELHGLHELPLVGRIGDGEVQVRLGRHVEKRHLYRSERLFHVPAEAGRPADVVPLPRVYLQDQVVRVLRAGESLREGRDVLLERG